MTEKKNNSPQEKVPRPLKRLIEAHQSLTDMESVDRVLDRLLDLARNVTNAEAASFMLYDPEDDVLKFAAARDEVLGESASEVLKGAVTLKIGEGIAGWVAENRQSINIQDAHKDSRFSQQADVKTGFVTRNLLCAPLLYGDQLLGVINVLNSKDKQNFDSLDEELLECFADLASTAITRSRFLEFRLRHERMQVQLEAASLIQSLFRPKLPEMGAGSRVWAVSQPATFVGGDVYDIILVPDGSWLMYVADVADKGLPAAMIMVALWSTIRNEAMVHRQVDKLLECVNNIMYDLMSKEGLFATIILTKYWPERGTMQLARAGHPPPLWVVGRNLADVPEMQGVALGIRHGSHYDKKEIVLSPGEAILFMSDGVTEAENEMEEMFGRRRLMESIETAKSPPYGKKLLDAVRSWRGRREANDDLTILEIWRERI